MICGNLVGKDINGENIVGEKVGVNRNTYILARCHLIHCDVRCAYYPFLPCDIWFPVENAFNLYEHGRIKKYDEVKTNEHANRAKYNTKIILYATL